MIEIKPFQALHYNPEKIRDLSKTVCPPYDVISPAQQNNYYNQSELNFIRVLLGKENPRDTESHNKYTRARDIFNQWIQDEILIKDEKPCIYYYLQDFRVLGEKYSRLGFISLMKVSDEKGARIYPHENTHMKAKQDRLKLWRMLSSNLSAIFVCYSDRNKKIEGIFNKKFMSAQPFINTLDDDGVRHRLWRLVDPALIREISDSLREQQLFIADGHHRYEVARELKRIKNPKGNKSARNPAYNYIMTYFTNMNSRDLKVFPIHRAIRKMPKPMDFLTEIFRVDRIKTRENLAILLAKAGKNEHAFGLMNAQGKSLLRLKNKLLIDKFIKNGSRALRHLDATILRHFILDRLAIRSEDIIYTKDIQEAERLVNEKEAEAAFLMNPVKIDQLREIALNGERMPPKTTYFYPKVLSGLTIYNIEK